VQVVDVAPLYGLLSVQGPKAAEVVKALGIFSELPAKEFQSAKVSDSMLGEIYLVNQSRVSGPGTAGVSPAGFDLFVPTDSLGAVADKLIAAAKTVGGCGCGWDALEIARIEAGIPRFGQDMDESNLPLECGIEARAVSYKKGCYIGQEVINRIHSIGHVNKELRGLRLAGDLKDLPAKGDKLFHDGKEVGYITSSMNSPTLNANIALGYVRREATNPGSELRLRTDLEETRVIIVEPPFIK
jgi:folate-binding protein YgfZ